jgi:hypothetical protein
VGYSMESHNMSQPIHVPKHQPDISRYTFINHHFPMVFPWFSHGFPKLIIHKPLGHPSQRLPVPRSIDPAKAVEGRRARRHPQVGLRRRWLNWKAIGKPWTNHRKTLECPGQKQVIEIGSGKFSDHTSNAHPFSIDSSLGRVNPSDQRVSDQGLFGGIPWHPGIGWPFKISGIHLQIKKPTAQ